jgi:hypothetical protein
VGKLGSMPAVNVAAEAPLDADIEEVRLAMALNGGVSPQRPQLTAPRIKHAR